MSVLIFVEFPTWHWHFDLVLNATMVTAHATMQVYIFHDHHFGASVMSLFFNPHNPFDDIALFVVHPPFHLPMYLSNAKMDFDTYLMPMYNIESNPTDPPIFP